MSHYSTIETEFRDEDVLVETLEEMEPNWVVERHSTPTNLFGYENDMRPEKAHLIIRRNYVGTASNDIGFVREGNTYRAIISEYDQGQHGAEWLGKLTQNYAANKVMKSMRVHGWRLGSRTTTEKGSIKMVLEV
jgi:hypothetical protein